MIHNLRVFELGQKFGEDKSPVSVSDWGYFWFQIIDIITWQRLGRSHNHPQFSEDLPLIKSVNTFADNVKNSN